LSHGCAFAGLQRQPRLRAVERLNLAFLVDRQHHRMTGRLHIQADDIFHLRGEGGIVGPLEGSQSVRLKAMPVPYALHCPQADADGFGDRAAGPVRGIAGRLGARQRQHPGYGLQLDRGFARLARPVPQEAIHALLGISQLPAPYRRAAEADLPGHLQNGQPVCRKKNDPRPMNVLLRAVAILNDRCQTRAVLRGNDDADGLCHIRRIARIRVFVNPLIASLH
jgi:hypothetical protein